MSKYLPPKSLQPRPNRERRDANDLLQEADEVELVHDSINEWLCVLQTAINTLSPEDPDEVHLETTLRLVAERIENHISDLQGIAGRLQEKAGVQPVMQVAPLSTRTPRSDEVEIELGAARAVIDSLYTAASTDSGREFLEQLDEESLPALLDSALKHLDRARELVRNPAAQQEAANG